MDERVQQNLEYQSFIGGNCQRYCDIFEKYEDEKVFIHTHWAAFLLGPGWMFYRNMFAWGTLAVIIEYILAYMAGFTMIGLYLLGFLQVSNPFADASVIAAEISATITVGMYITQFVSRFFFSLFADCIYRAFIRKNARYTDGGVTTVGFLIGIGINAFIGWLSGKVLELLLGAIVMLIQ